MSQQNVTFLVVGGVGSFESANYKGENVDEIVGRRSATATARYYSDSEPEPKPAEAIVLQRNNRKCKCVSGKRRLCRRHRNGVR